MNKKHFHYIEYYVCILTFLYPEIVLYSGESTGKKQKIWSFHFQTIPDDPATNLLNECY